MKLLQKLISEIPHTLVEEVIIGVHSTLIKTELSCGIASTIKYCNPYENIHNAGKLEELTLQKLAEYSLSHNLLEASIGMAAINCYYSQKILKYAEINAKDIILEKGINKNVGIIGHFPFLEKQRDKYKNCYIFEKQPQEGDLTEIDIPKYLPGVDVAAITATAITNHTFEDILKYLSKKSFNIMLGPSTPLAPILFNFGLDVISGSIVENYKVLKKYVMQATPTRHLKGLKMATIFQEDYL